MDNKVETILLTGGLGYIGSITAVTLYPNLSEFSKQSNKKYKIVIIDNLSNSRNTVVKRINQSISEALGVPHQDNLEYVEFLQIDITNQEKLNELFQNKVTQGEPINYIIHFASLKAVGESVLKPLMYFQNNLGGTMNLLQACSQFKCTNFLFSSSATVYKAGENLDEEQLIYPSNPYGETKIAIDYLIRSVQKADGGRVVSLRYFNPVGALQNGLLGDSPSVFPNNLFPFIEQVAVGNRPHLNIFGKDYPTQDGTGVRDYIHVKDLAEGHVVVLKKLVEKNEQQENWYNTYNLGSGKGYSVLEIVNAYSKVLGKELPHQFAPRRGGDVEVLTANPDKAKRELQWQTKLTLDEMCQDSYNFIKKNPNGIQD